MNSPFFSVIIPTYNRKDFLAIALRSVLEQNFEDFQVIVVDDGSTDETCEFVRSVKDPRLVYFWHEHLGVSAMRNIGVRASQGEFICFLDSDDRYRANKLEVTRDYILNNPEYKIFHSQEIWYRRGELLPQKKHHQKPHGMVFEQAVKLCCISISTTAIHHQVFRDAGLFDETLPACEDYDFWLRATAKRPVFLIPDYLTIKEGGHPDQQSAKFPAMDTFRIAALKNILEQGGLSGPQRKAALVELRNKCSIYIQGALKRGNTAQAEIYQTLLAKFPKDD